MYVCSGCQYCTIMFPSWECNNLLQKKMVPSKVTSTALLHYYFSNNVRGVGITILFFNLGSDLLEGTRKIALRDNSSECCQYRDIAVVAIFNLCQQEHLCGNITSLISCILVEPRCFFSFHTHWQLYMPLINLLFSTRVTTILVPNSISLRSSHAFF